MKIKLDVEKNITKRGEKMVTIEVKENTTPFTSYIFVKQVGKNDRVREIDENDNLVEVSDDEQYYTYIGKFIVADDKEVEEIIEKIKSVYSALIENTKDWEGKKEVEINF